MERNVARAGPARPDADLRHYARWAYVLAGGAVVVGGLLVPRGDELLLIHVKNNDVERARAVLADVGAHGVSTAASVVAHGELYLYEGHVDAAVLDVEAYAEARPDDVAAWTRLAELYRHDQRTADETRALEHVYRIASSPERARTLIARFRRTGDEVAEAAMLRDLVAAGEADADELVRSARLEAAFGKYERAIEALERLRGTEPSALDYPATELYASLLIDTGRIDQLARFQRLPIVLEDPAVIVTLATALGSWGRRDAAITLLQPQPGFRPVPEWLTALAYVARGTDRAAAVAADLLAIDAATPLAGEPLQALVSLALTLPDSATIVDRLLAREGRSWDSDVLAAIIGHAATHGARDRAQALIARLGDDSLRGSPMLALDLALERRDVAAAERWIAFVDDLDPTPDQQAALAQAEGALGREALAYERLARVAATGRAPAWALGAWTTLASSLGRVDETLAALEPLATTSSEGRAAWARLAATSGRIDLIDAWIARDVTRAVDAQTMRDVYHALADRQEIRLAVEVARRLYAATDRAEDAVRLGQALLAAGRPVDALGPLRRFGMTDPDAAPVYDAALYAAQAAGVDVAAELRPVFFARLQQPHLSESRLDTLVEGLWMAGTRASIAGEIVRAARRDLDRWLSPLVEVARGLPVREEAIAIVVAALTALRDHDASAIGRREALTHALVDLDAPDATVLPLLERLAAEAGGSWVHAYDERLARLGRTADRVALWAKLGASTRVSADDRRAAAARLHELGASAQAARLMQSLAATAGPLDPDVEALLFYWGPPPSREQRSWLVARLRGAPAADQPLWIQRLVNVGGADDVIEALPILPKAAAPAFVEVWLAAHRAAANPRRLRDAIVAVLDRPQPGADEPRLVGRLAVAEGLFDLAMRAYRAVLSSRPSDLEAMRWLGTLSFYAGQTTEARRWLNAYHAAGGDEPEPLYQLGELARASGDDSRARSLFERTLERLRASDEGTAREALRANVLVRLDERASATAAFEALLRGDPQLDHIRADYVAALLEWGDYDRARRVLGLDLDGPVIQRSVSPPMESSVSRRGADESGARRLDLLAVQLLTYQGRYGRAEAVLDALAQRHPNDPDVLIARGAFDTERGRHAAADAAFQAARRYAPGREDIADLLARRARERSPHGTLEFETRSVGQAWDQRMATAMFEASLRPQTNLSVVVDELRFSAPSLLQPDGVVRSAASTRRRFEATITTPVGAGTSVAAALLGADGHLGTSWILRRHDLFGSSSVIAELQRPFWEFTETAANGGWRDRIGIERQFRLGARTSAWALVNWNRYGLEGGARASSAAVTLGIVRSVRREAPTIVLQYGLDVERRLRATEARTPDGISFLPIPLVTREVHVAGVVSRFTAAWWDVEAAGGYAVDRLGGRGAYGTVRLTPPARARMGLALWAERRLFQTLTTQYETRAGAGLRVGF